MREQEWKKAQERYIESGGSICPHCGSKNITGDSVNFEGSEISQAVYCEDCEADWTDVFKLAYIEQSPSEVEK